MNDTMIDDDNSPFFLIREIYILLHFICPTYIDFYTTYIIVNTI